MFDVQLQVLGCLCWKACPTYRSEMAELAASWVAHCSPASRPPSPPTHTQCLAARSCRKQPSKNKFAEGHSRGPRTAGLGLFLTCVPVKKRACGRTTANASPCCTLRRSSTTWGVRGVLCEAFVESVLFTIVCTSLVRDILRSRPRMSGSMFPGESWLPRCL